MATSKNKTIENNDDVMQFINAVTDEIKKQDALQLLKMMEKITKEPAKMWGKSIVGFGKYHYKYESGREGDFMKIGFSPRKQNLTLYIMPGFSRYTELLEKLGKHSTGKSCLYIKKLTDVDKAVLIELIGTSYTHMTNKYG